jgi:shikimate dehydrogenase
MYMMERARLFGVPKLFAVLGDPVDHSLSPAMHEAGYKARRLAHVYLRHRVTQAELGAALDDARRLRMGGLNLTVPLKETALSLVDGLTPAARRIGAVNTVVPRPGGRLIGDNTDGLGFVRSLRGLVRVRGARVLVIGAGGSARAVGVALADAGVARLTLVNRTQSRAEALAVRLAEAGATDVEVATFDMLSTGEILVDTDVVVNTTSAGLEGAALPLHVGATPRTTLFVDLLYGARPTPFVAAARRAGRRALDGSGMLLHQGALAFERWLGGRAPLAAMESALVAHGLTTLTRLPINPSVAVRRPRTS